jgi:putative Mn2+ efflux pump MntP
MDLSAVFFFNNILLGLGLAMDAFSVSLANGLGEPGMKPQRMCGVAGIFAGFQGLMPLIGWVCVHTVLEHFSAFEKLIPWIALALLGYIGGSMLWDGIRCKGAECEVRSRVTLSALLVQGIATSIDALSVGFTIAVYRLPEAILAALIIAAVTFLICMGGLHIGRKAGTRLAGKAGILGGSILIFIGLEIFITSFL